MKKSIMLGVLMLFCLPALFAQTKAGKVDTLKHATYYICTHHPSEVSNKPGKCPVCGMELTLTSKEQMKRNVSKNYTCPVHVEVTSHDPGKCPQCGRKLNLSPKEQMKAETVKLYTCPMHPEVSLDKDGKCPKCGSKLVEKKDKTQTE